MFGFNGLDAKHSLSALVCTVLFSTTCVLSAVGPARAVETAEAPVRIASASVSPVVAPLA
jgi:hypothetical protein